MLSSYIRAAMARARYEILPDDGTYYGEIPDCQGVWADRSTLDECRAELQEVLEDWIVFRLANGMSLPTIDGVTLSVTRVA